MLSPISLVRGKILLNQKKWWPGGKAFANGVIASLDGKLFCNKKRWRFLLVYLTILTTLLFLYCVIKNNQTFYWDSLTYWGLGQSFFAEGHFSFLNYPETIRGYSLPLLLGMCGQLGNAFFGNAYVLYWLTSSLMVVLLIAFLLPLLMRVEFFSLRYMVGAFTAICCFVYFWPFLLIQPNSDLPALTLYAAILCILKELACGKYSLRFSLTMTFLAGVLSYTAYNIRTVYLYPLVLLWGIYLLFVIMKHPIRGGGHLLAALLGICVASIPQIIINQNLYQILTPKIFTPYNGADNLFLAQLQAGISSPRYETYVGDTAIFPTPGVPFQDEIGIALSQNITSVLDFLRWMLTHCLDACALYWEHFVSGITRFNREVYLTEIYVKPIVYLSNCAIFLAGLVGIISTTSSKKPTISDAIFVLPFVFLFLPAIMALFGAVETRFFLPIYLLVYTFLFLKVSGKALISYVCTHKAFVIVLVLTIFLTWNTTAAHILAEVTPGTLTLGGQYFP